MEQSHADRGGFNKRVGNNPNRRQGGNGFGRRPQDRFDYNNQCPQQQQQQEGRYYRDDNRGRGGNGGGGCYNGDRNNQRRYGNNFNDDGRRGNYNDRGNRQGHYGGLSREGSGSRDGPRDGNNFNDDGRRGNYNDRGNRQGHYGGLSREGSGSRDGPRDVCRDGQRRYSERPAASTINMANDLQGAINRVDSQMKYYVEQLEQRLTNAEAIISELKRQLKQKDDEIKQKDDEIKQKDDEIKQKDEKIEWLCLKLKSFEQNESVENSNTIGGLAEKLLDIPKMLCGQICDVPDVNVFEGADMGGYGGDM